MIKETLSAIIVIFLLPALCSAYSFDAHSSVQNSVILVLNQQKSSGDIIAFDVVANGVSNISGAAFDIDFNNSVIKWAGKFSHDPDGYEKGDFFTPSALYAIGPQRYLNGTVDINKLIVGIADEPDSSREGNGNIITIKFKAVSSGDVDISFSNNNLILPDRSLSNAQWFGGTLHIGTNEQLEKTEDSDNPPTVSLNTPQDKATIHKNNLELTCTASDDYGIAEITLYSNITGTWQAHSTVQVSGTSVAHTFSVAGLTEGTYKWNCETTDTKSQKSFAVSDYVFTVRLPSDHTPPAISGSTSLCYNESVSYANLTVYTDETAVCKYTFSPNIPYIAMLYTFNSTNSTTHTTEVHVPSGYEYRYYVKCRDAHGNENTKDFVIEFYVGNVSEDADSPDIINLVSGNNVNPDRNYITISLSTNENAECRYSAKSNTPFSSMKLFEHTGLNNHTMKLYGLSEGTQYTYYIQCSDINGNVNDKRPVMFFVCYESDENCDRKISLMEAKNYITRWMNNEYDINIKKLIKTLKLWKSGHA